MHLDYPCIETDWPRLPSGYGVRGGGHGRRQLRSNRVALEEKLGRPLLSGMQALHHCDNPPCIQPEHLYEGTASQNMHDMYHRNRHPRTGGRPGQPEPVKEAVRARYAAGQGQKFIASRFGIGQATVSRIVNESK